MLRYCSRSTWRIGRLCTCGKLFCRIWVIIRVWILVVRVLCLIYLWYITGLIHRRDREILISGIKLRKPDIYSTVGDIIEFITVHIDNLYPGFCIRCLYCKQSLGYSRIKRGLGGIETLYGTAAFIALVARISHEYIYRTVLRDLYVHILGNILVTSILPDLGSDALNSEVSCVQDILNLKSNLYGCTSSVPAFWSIDGDLHAGFFVLTVLIISTAYGTVLVVIVLTALVVADALRRRFRCRLRSRFGGRCGIISLFSFFTVAGIPVAGFSVAGISVIGISGTGFSANRLIICAIIGISFIRSISRDIVFCICRDCVWCICNKRSKRQSKKHHR